MTAVFRQYFTTDDTLSYLVNDGTHKQPDQLKNVYWIPLGYGKLRAMPEFKIPLPARNLLWTWMGSTAGKQERAEVVRILQDLEQEQSHESLLHLYDNFFGPGNKAGMEYSFTMYETKFVPLPAGASPEQYRLWEAFEAGET